MRLRRLLPSLLGVLFGAGAAGAAPMAFLVIDGHEGYAEVYPGIPFTVEVRASEIPAGSDVEHPGMFGFGFSIRFDASAFTSGVPVAQAIWTGASGSRNDPGDVGLTANRLGEPSGPFGDDILLGTVEWIAQPLPGLYALDLTYFDSPGENLLFDFTVLDSSESFFLDGSILVVPEAGTAPLLLLGLGALALGRR